MEFTREMYWNVGSGVILPMYFMVAAAVAVMIFGFLRRAAVYRKGQATVRTDNFGQRLGNYLTTVLSQKKVSRTGAGKAHAVFFWGFLLLTLGTTLIFIQEDILKPLGGSAFLSGRFYKLFSLTLDIAGVMALVGLGYLAVRRYVLKPEGLETKKDDAIMHILLFGILFTGFLIEGSRMAATEMNSPDALWSPVGYLFALVLGGAGLHAAFWWTHFALVLAFFVSIPFTKFRHIVTASTNELLADTRPKGALNLMSFEDEDALYGVNHPEHYSWKDLFDTDACTSCARCQDVCPANATEKPLSPMKVVHTIGNAAFTGDTTPLTDLVGEDAIWSCTTCRACQEACPAGVEQPSKIIDLRRQLVQMEARFPEELLGFFENIEQRSNPWGIAPAERDKWSKQMPIKPFTAGETEYLVFVGCAGSFDARNKQVSIALAKILDAAGVSWGTLGNEEKCCGDSVRRLGNEYVFSKIAEENVAKMQERGVTKIITQCPHCFSTLKNDYTQFGGEFEVIHHSQFIAQLMADEKIAVKAQPQTVTLHDSCYLARYNGVTAEPRAVLAGAGAQIVEMAKNGEDGFCCGAGGGRMWVEEQIGTRINRNRADQAIATGADTVCTACPYCMTMMGDGLKDEGAADVAVKDIAEIVLENMK